MDWYVHLESSRILYFKQSSHRTPTIILMKFCRFLPLDTSVARPASPLYGLLEDGEVRELSGSSLGTMVAHGAHVAAPGRAPCRARRAGENCLRRPQLCGPRCGTGQRRAERTDDFLKPSSSIIGPGEPIVLARLLAAGRTRGRTGIVIGRRCAHLRDSDDALENVLATPVSTT